MSQDMALGATGALAALPDLKDCIRLLKAIATSEGQFPEFQLSAHRITQLPSYYAVSYVWGSGKTTSTISINEQSYLVRQNCRDALFQAWRHGGPRYYWIDAIYIDQENKDEKSDQVALMGDVFDNATKVLSCIGEHEDDSENVMKVLDTMPKDLVGKDWPDMAAASRVLDWLLQRPTRDVKSLVESLTAIILRPYFSRVWILQEAFRKHSRTIICCGHQWASFEALFALKTAFYQSSLALEPPCHLELISLWSSYADYGFPSRSSSLLIHVNFPGKRGNNSQARWTTEDGKDSLEEVLDMASALDCTDIRDRIYGTLPLINWECHMPISPDYHKSRFELTIDVLRHGWLHDKFQTLNRISRLTETFKLFVQNEDSHQFHETANAIIGRCQEVQSGQRHDQVLEHSERLILTGWEETSAEDESALREGGTLESRVSRKRAQIILIPTMQDLQDRYVSDIRQSGRSRQRSHDFSRDLSQYATAALPT